MTRARMITLALLSCAWLPAACSNTAVNSALSTPAGQLFCAISTSGGSTIVAGIINAAATAASPSLGPVAVIATNVAAADVQSDCTKAAAATGGISGVPVSPPPVAAVVPQVAIVTKTST